MSTTSEPTARQDAAARTPKPGAASRPGLILAFLCVAGFMTFLDVSIVNVSLPTIERELHITQAVLQYVVTTYGTVLGGFLLLGGRLADALGRRRMLQAGLVVFALASLMAGLANGPVMLVTARGVQGLGSAFVAPAALSLLTNTFAEGPARTRALGVWGGISGVASVAGVIAGGLLTEGPGWRWIFFINVPIGLAGFAAIERRASAPLIPLSIFRLRVMRTANVTAVAMFGALVTLFFFASLYMQQVLGYSPVRTGLAYVPIAVIVSVGAGISQGLVSKVAAKPVPIAGLGLAAAGLVLLWRVPVHASYPADILPAFLAGGLGLGLAFVPVQVAAFGGVGKSDS